MKRPDTDTLDLSRWPSVDVNALDEKARQGYQQRAMAVEHYSTGISIDDVEKKTNVDRRVLYRVIERAVRAHPDGRPW